MLRVCAVGPMQERRILMVAQERDTVSMAVHAAAALLWPLRWQHIYLPLLPLALKVQPQTCKMGASHPLRSAERHCLSCNDYNLVERRLC